MSSMWGKHLQLALFGESHGEAVGMVLHGLPPGIPTDEKRVFDMLSRRAGGKGDLTTARAEKDKPRFVSGLYRGVTDGAPICALFGNSDVKPDDDALLHTFARPSHADFPAQIKYRGFRDPRGGGHFSGRLTAPLVLAGALCEGYLASKGIAIGAQILQIGMARGDALTPDECTKERLAAFACDPFPALSEGKKRAMMKEIISARALGDSVGGIVECAAAGLPVGVGEPFFDSVESVLSHLVFSIPGVRGVSFGEGFALAALRGSEANDAFEMRNGRAVPRGNNAGGVNGGLANGMPLILRAAFRPTPSIARPQQMARLDGTGVEEKSVLGRHDPCIVPRAVPAIEAAVALGLTELMLSDPRLTQATGE